MAQSVRPQQQRKVYADFLAVPDTSVAEILHEELYVEPRPAGPHARASTVLGGELHAPFARGKGGPGGWTLLDEPELRLRGHILVPDLAGWRSERLTSTDVPYFEVAPDWVCEVLSQRTREKDREVKMPLYASAGVRHLWLLDPKPKTLEIYRAVAGEWSFVRTAQGRDMLYAEPFDAIELELGVLWER